MNIKGIKEDGDDTSSSEDGMGVDIGDLQKLQALAEYIKMPAPIKRRVKALKKLLHGSIHVEREFYREVFALEKKFEERYVHFWDKRKNIVNGSVEPTDEECEWPYDDENDLNLSEALSRQQIAGDESVDVEEGTDDKGIPSFWLKALLHCPTTESMITDNDQPILKHMTDLQVRLIADGEEMGFILEFHFEENPYFNETVLTKQYIFDSKPSEEHPLDYDGPEIVQCRGCKINWKPGKNVTIKIVKKVKKHKNRKELRTLTKTVKRDSFFNFFDPPLQAMTDPDIDEDTADLLQSDFHIGHFMREGLVPKAVLYFTGEASDSDDDDDDEDDEDDIDDDDDDEDDIDDSDDEPLKGKRNRPKKTGNSGKGGSAEKPPECQQS